MQIAMGRLHKKTQKNLLFQAESTKGAGKRNRTEPTVEFCLAL